MAFSSLSVLTQPSLIAITGKYHGLGNRVRVVLGSRSLSRLENRRFFYTWQTGAQFGARLDDLWKIDEEVIPRSATRILSARYPYRDEKLGWLDDATRLQRVLQIKTPHALHLPAPATPWEDDLRALHLVDEVGTVVRDFYAAHLIHSPFVGVMVRAHSNSHEATLRESPIAWYVDRMRQIRKSRPDTRFFVSADTESAQREISNAVPQSFSLSNKGGYNSKQALRSSVADLYLLASSTHILGPYFSSFPELAQKLAGQGVALETSHSGPDTKWEALRSLSVVDDPTTPHRRRTL